MRLLQRDEKRILISVYITPNFNNNLRGQVKPLTSNRMASGSGIEGGTNGVRDSSDSSGATAMSLKTRVAGVRVNREPPPIPPIPTPSSTRLQDSTTSATPLAERED